jgi:hypothetical protein
MEMKHNIRKNILILTSLLGVTLLIGHGCSKFASNENDESSISDLGGGGVGGGDLTIVPNASTVSLLYNKQFVANMVNCTGIGQASLTTLNEWTNRQNSFSEYGYGVDITAPMLMAVTAVSGEICNDVLSRELPLPMGLSTSAGRQIFYDWNFAQGPVSLTNLAIENAARSLAISCWSRDTTAEELGIIQEEVALLTQAAATTTSSPEETRKVALAMCTGMLSSMSGIIF